MVSEGVNAEVTAIPILLDVTTEAEAQAAFDVSTQVMVSFVAKVVDVYVLPLFVPGALTPLTFHL